MPGLSEQSNHIDLRPDHVLTEGELAVASNVDVVGNQPITVLKVALPESGTTSVKIPGSDIVPKRGEYLASPALANAHLLPPRRPARRPLWQARWVS